MAIQLPKVQKNDVYNAALPLPKAEAVGSSELANASIDMIDTVTTTGTKYIEALEKEEDLAAKNRSKALGNEYNKAVDKLSAQFSALPLGSDITAQYNELKNQQTKIKENLLKYAYDSKTKELLNNEFDSQDAVLNKAIEVKYAQGNIAYQVRTNKDRNTILQRNFITGATQYNPNDKTSYADMDSALVQIGENKLGFATTDANGQTMYPDTIDKDIRNSKSDAVNLAVRSLIGSGDVTRATGVYNRYGGLVNEKDKVDLKNQLTKANNKQQNHMMADQIVRMNPEDQEQRYNEIAETFGVERKEDIGNIVASLKADRDRIEKEKNQQRFNKAYDIVTNNQNQPTNKWYTVEQMKRDPVISDIYEKSDYATKQKIERLVKKPTQSDPESLRFAMTFYDRPDGFKGMSKEKFAELVGPLDSKDTEKMTYQYEIHNGIRKASPMGDAAVNDIKSNVYKILAETDVLKSSSGISSFLLGSSDTTADKKSKFFQIYELRLLQELNNYTGSIDSQADRLKLSQDIAAKYIKEYKDKNKSWFDFSGDDEPTPQPQQVTPPVTIPPPVSTPATVQTNNTSQTTTLTSTQRRAVNRKALNLTGE